MASLNFACSSLIPLILSTGAPLNSADEYLCLRLLILRMLYSRAADFEINLAINR